MSDDIYMLVGDDGEAVGMLNMDLIHTEGVKFAFGLAAVCDDPAAMDALQAETLKRVGDDTFRYVAANALRTMAAHILSPSFDVAQAHGTDLRSGMKAIAEGRQPW